MHDPSRGPRGGPGWSGRAFVTLGLGCAVAASLTGCPSSEPSSTSLFDLADVVAETDASDPECANDDACQPESADPCRTWTCEAGSCKVEDRPDGEACDGDRAWLGQACAAGVCAGGTARYECDVIAFEGCCTPEGDLFFCDDDALTWHGCNGGGGAATAGATAPAAAARAHRDNDGDGWPMSARRGPRSSAADAARVSMTGDVATDGEDAR